MVTAWADPGFVAVRNAVQVGLATLNHRAERLGHDVGTHHLVPRQTLAEIMARAGRIADRIGAAHADAVVVRPDRLAGRCRDRRIAHAQAEVERQRDDAAQVAQMATRTRVWEQQARASIRQRHATGCVCCKFPTGGVMNIWYTLVPIATFLHPICGRY